MTLLRTYEPRRLIAIWYGLAFLSFFPCNGIAKEPSCEDCFCGHACVTLKSADVPHLSCNDYQAQLLLSYKPESGCNNTFFEQSQKSLAARCTLTKKHKNPHQCFFIRYLSEIEEVVSTVIIIVAIVSVLLVSEGHH